MVDHTVDWPKPGKLVGMVETFDAYLELQYLYVYVQIRIYPHMHVLCSDSMLVLTGVHDSSFRDLDGIIPFSNSSW